jgi:hypothetical protein
VEFSAATAVQAFTATAASTTPCLDALKHGGRAVVACVPPDRRTYYASSRSSTPKAGLFLEEDGWRRAPSIEAATLVWARKDRDDYLDSWEKAGGSRRASENENDGAPRLINHVRREGAMIDKGHLSWHLRAHDATHPHDALNATTIHPETYRLYASDECRAFFDAPHRDATTWVLKPADLSRGIGIRVVPHAATLVPQFGACIDATDAARRLHALADAAYRGDDVDVDAFVARAPSMSRYVVQRYIRDPVLYEGCKTETRAYILVASVSPLRVLYHRGTVRRTLETYEEGDWTNSLRHVTNVYQQRDHPEYEVRRQSLKLPWSALLDAVREQVRFADDDGTALDAFVDHGLEHRMRTIATRVVNATYADWSHSPSGTFTLMGADFILDRRGGVWLTEFQLNPGKSMDDPVKREMMPRMLGGALDVAVEVAAREAEGSLGGDGDLYSVRGGARGEGWQWLVDASRSPPYVYA